MLIKRTLSFLTNLQKHKNYQYFILTKTAKTFLKVRQQQSLKYPSAVTEELDICSNIRP